MFGPVGDPRFLIVDSAAAITAVETSPVHIWVWLKMFNRRGKPPGLATMFPLTRVPFWYRFFEPQPFGEP